MKTPFQLMAESGVPLLLIGGHALHAHGYSRLTLDFDCLILAGDEARMKGYLENAGWEEVFRTRSFGKYRSLGADASVIDVMFVEAETFTRLSAESFQFTFGEVTLRVPALMHLVAMKLHAIKNDPQRESRDAGDIVELLRRNKDRWTPGQFEETCRRFGLAEVCSRIRPLLSP
ncbi:MAG: nucleotidyltransferase family protein [Verrucomicrobiota bacterium]|nr:nucleotidyltransferase family protein [Verrucomicrobiota bacterium]